MKKIISLISLILCTLAILTIYFIKQDNNKYIAVYLNNIESTSIPDRNSNYIIDKIICDNDAIGTWDNVNWGLLVTNLSKRSNCKTYFRSKKDITVIYDNNYIENNIFEKTYAKTIPNSFIDKYLINKIHNKTFEEPDIMLAKPYSMFLPSPLEICNIKFNNDVLNVIIKIYSIFFIFNILRQMKYILMNINNCTRITIIPFVIIFLISLLFSLLSIRKRNIPFSN